MKRFLKGSAVWLAAFAVLLAGLWSFLGGEPAPAPEQPQNTAAGEATGNGADLDDTLTGDSGASPVDLEDEEGGAADDAGGAEEDDPSALVPSPGIPAIREKLSWEAIRSFPIKSSDMSTDQLRALCVDFLRYTKTALWTPKEDISYIKNGSGTADAMSAGIVYGGLPYVGVASGNVYRLMDFMDESTGVVDISRFLEGTSDMSQTVTMAQLKYFGSQCSIGAYWGWGRVINSADYLWTSGMTGANGFIPLGEYTYTTTGWANRDGYRTTDVVTANGQQVMYRSYARLKPADGLNYFTSAGHVIMCASDAHVEYLENGDIDGDNSYIYMIDQAQTWLDGENESGDSYRYKNSVDKKVTFAYLFSHNYIPFTFAEFLGTDPVEETAVSFSHAGSTITASQLFSSVVTANYGISDIYAMVTDDSGNEVYRHIVRTATAGNMDLRVAESGEGVDTLGTLEPGTYNIEIAVQLATGERPTVYNGKLIMDN